MGELIKAKVVIGKGAARQGTPGHFCGLENAHVCVSAQTWLQSSLIFVLIHHSHRVLSDVNVLWNHLCPTGECQGRPMRVRPAPRCQGLFFSLSHSFYSGFVELASYSSELNGKIHTEIPIPSHLGCFCLVFLGGLYVNQWTLCCFVLPRFPIYKAEETQFHLPIICIAGKW